MNEIWREASHRPTDCIVLVLYNLALIHLFCPTLLLHLFCSLFILLLSAFHHSTPHFSTLLYFAGTTLKYTVCAIER